MSKRKLLKIRKYVTFLLSCLTGFLASFLIPYFFHADNIKNSELQMLKSQDRVHKVSAYLNFEKVFLASQNLLNLCYQNQQKLAFLNIENVHIDELIEKSLRAETINLLNGDVDSRINTLIEFEFIDISNFPIEKYKKLLFKEKVENKALNLLDEEYKSIFLKNILKERFEQKVKFKNELSSEFTSSLLYFSEAKKAIEEAYKFTYILGEPTSRLAILNEPAKLAYFSWTKENSHLARSFVGLHDQNSRGIESVSKLGQEYFSSYDQYIFTMFFRDIMLTNFTAYVAMRYLEETSIEDMVEGKHDNKFVTDFVIKSRKMFLENILGTSIESLLDSDCKGAMLRGRELFKQTYTNDEILKFTEWNIKKLRNIKNHTFSEYDYSSFLNNKLN